MGGQRTDADGCNPRLQETSRHIECVGFITPQRPGIHRRQHQQHGRQGGSDQRYDVSVPGFAIRFNDMRLEIERGSIARQLIPRAGYMCDRQRRP
jgi:hypothetical protein